MNNIYFLLIFFVAINKREFRIEEEMQFTIFYALVLYASAFLLHCGEGARILGIFPIPAKSHFTCSNAIMKSLIDAGHEVTVITPFPEQASAENYTSIIDISEKELMLVGHATFDKYITRNVFRCINVTIDIEQPYCSKVLNLPEIQKILKSDEKLYDVVFVEIIFFYRCFLHVAEKMNTPVIGTVSMRTWIIADHAIHNPHHPAYVPFESVTQKWHLNHIVGRVMNVWDTIVMSLFKSYVLPEMIKKFHEDNVDQLGSLKKYMHMEPDLIFFNNHASFLPRPMNPNAIDIGGIHTKNAKPLPGNIQKFIDEAEHKAILFSFGSVVRGATMDEHVRNAFRDAFAEIPQRVVWKFEEEIENIPDNVLLLDWLPQRDILEHRNVIAFISHCGLGSMNEAVYTATPVVACPLFADQIDNAELLENRGVAVHLDINDISKENILVALNLIINDTRYFNNMQKLSKVFKDRPMTPQQTIVYWTEYVIWHDGAPHLKTPAARLYWFQYLLLDVICTGIIILVFTAYFITRIVKFICFQFSKCFKLYNYSKLKNKTN